MARKRRRFMCDQCQIEKFELKYTINSGGAFCRACHDGLKSGSLTPRNKGMKKQKTKITTECEGKKHHELLTFFRGAMCGAYRHKNAFFSIYCSRVADSSRICEHCSNMWLSKLRHRVSYLKRVISDYADSAKILSAPSIPYKSNLTPFAMNLLLLKANSVLRTFRMKNQKSQYLVLCWREQYPPVCCRWTASFTSILCVHFLISTIRPALPIDTLNKS